MRRVGDLQFDHGAQFVNADGAEFAAVSDGLSVAGRRDGTGRTNSVGVPGMSAIPKALGAGLDIRLGVQVCRLQQDGDGWLLQLEGASLRAARVVVTVPAPQIAGVLGVEHPLVAKLAPVRVAPCLTLMAAVDGRAPFITRQDPDDPRHGSRKTGPSRATRRVRAPCGWRRRARRSAWRIWTTLQKRLPP